MAYSGPLLFLLALLPVGLFFRTLHNLQRCLSRPDLRRKARHQALVHMPLIIVIAPVFMTVWMMVESRMDPAFIARSFADIDSAATMELFGFALDQTVRALAADALETFGVSLTPLAHTCHSVLFCTSLVIFKAFVGLAATVWALAVLSWIRERFARGRDTS